MGAAASTALQEEMATHPREGDAIVNSGPASFEAARSEVRRLRQALWAHAARLPSLGPFHLVRLREKHVRIVTREVPNVETPVVFEIAGPRSLVDLCQHNNYPMVGRVSRLRPLTFDAKQLEKAGIHPHAVWFGFCYPTQRGIDDDDDDDDDVAVAAGRRSDVELERARGLPQIVPRSRRLRVLR